ncbi:IclR family transcriptional regulator [Paraburkholderia dipogonis]
MNMKTVSAPKKPSIQPGGKVVPASTGRRVRPVPAVTRAVAILRLLGKSNIGLGVKAIAQELNLVPSTCLHILRVLVEEDLIKVDPATKRYSMAVGMLALARNVLETLTFPNVVQPVLDRLAAEWEVSAIGVEVSGIDHMTVLALSKSKAPFRLQVDVGSRFPALVSATGRLVAAYSNLPSREIDRAFRDLRWGKAPNLGTWRKEVESVKKRGYSIDRGNYILGVVVVAAPVVDEHGQLTHTLVAVGVADQLDELQCTTLAQELKAEAEKLSAAPSAIN